MRDEENLDDGGDEAVNFDGGDGPVVNVVGAAGACGDGGDTAAG